MVHGPHVQLRLASAVIDLDSWRVLRDGVEHQLTPVEHRLLSWFVAHPGQLFTQEDLLVNVWGYRPGVYSRTVYTTVQRLRKKLEADPGRPVHIVSVYGAGYRLVLEP